MRLKKLVTLCLLAPLAACNNDMASDSSSSNAGTSQADVSKATTVNLDSLVNTLQDRWQLTEQSIVWHVNYHGYFCTNA